MSKKGNQKAKLLYLQQILLEETDDKYMLTVQQLIEKLEKIGIPAERKSLYDDIATLQNFGMDIVVNRSRANSYGVGSRLFTQQEIKLLTDMIFEHPGLGASKVEKLIIKLGKLVSKYKAEQLNKTLASKRYEEAEHMCPVELRCSNDITPNVLEYLTESKIKKSKQDISVIEGTVIADQAFYNWLFGLGNKVRLIGPNNVKKDFIKHCKKVLSEYK